MDYSLFANPPPHQFFTGVGVGIFLSAILIVAFLLRGYSFSMTTAVP